MNRAAFEVRLQELLDERRTPSSDVELLRAAEQDPELKQFLSAFELLSGIRDAVPAVSADLTERVVSAWREAPSTVRLATSPAWLAPLVAVAATLLIATSIAFLAKDRPDGEMANTKRGIPGPTVADAPTPPKPAPSLNYLTRQAADNYRKLAATTGESLTSALSVVQTGRQSDDAHSATSGSREDWLRSVPSSLRPLSSSTSGAVFSLMRAVPGTNDDAQDEL